VAEAHRPPVSAASAVPAVPVRRARHARGRLTDPVLARRPGALTPARRTA